MYLGIYAYQSPNKILHTFILFMAFFRSRYFYDTFSFLIIGKIDFLEKIFI